MLSSLQWKSLASRRGYKLSICHRTLSEASIIPCLFFSSASLQVYIPPMPPLQVYILPMPPLQVYISPMPPLQVYILPISPLQVYILAPTAGVHPTHAPTAGVHLTHAPTAGVHPTQVEVDLNRSQLFCDTLGRCYLIKGIVIL